MVLRPRNGLSLCAGAGGLDLGLMLAEPGFHTRCWVEWEKHPRDAIIAGQRAGYFAPAPIWDDVTTFDGRPYRGYIDTILAGYPCQGESYAGKRLGKDDERWLWDDIARIIDEIDPTWVILENVAGHVTLGAETVLRTLWEMDRTPAAGLFTAEEVGAPHKRERWFCVAHREGSDGRGELETGRTGGGRSRSTGSGEELADGASGGCGKLGDEAQPRCGGHPDGGVSDVANADGGNASPERELSGGVQRFQSRRGGALENTGRPERRSGDAERDNLNRDDAGRQESHRGARQSSGPLVDTLQGRTRTRAQPPEQSPEVGTGRGSGPQLGYADQNVDNTEPHGRTARRHGDNAGNVGQQLDAEGSTVADPERCAGHEGREGDPGSGIGSRGQASTIPVGSIPCLFPPGPSDQSGWLELLDRAPDMAPALSLREVHAWARRCEALGIDWQNEAQSNLRQCVDGLATRTRALKLCGNGVLPLEAAHAIRTLCAAHGLGPVDLEAASRNEEYTG